MFAPEGYYSWIDILDAVDHWADILLRAKLKENAGADPTAAFSEPRRGPAFINLLEAKLAASHEEALFISGMLDCWLLANFLANYDTLICSSSGTVLRSTPAIYLHVDRLDWCPWEWPKESGPYLGSYLKLHRENNFNVSDIHARFCSIDTLTGLVKIKNNTGIMLHQAMNNREKPIDSWLELVRPFSGWAVCSEPSKFPKTFVELFEAFGLEEAEWAKAAEKTAPPLMAGRHSNKEPSIRAVANFALEAFPNGKGSATWQDVENRVGYSRRHIVRALKEYGKYDAWAGTGQSAV